MLRVVIRSSKRQLKLGLPQQPVHEAIQSQEQIMFSSQQNSRI